MNKFFVSLLLSLSSFIVLGQATFPSDIDKECLHFESLSKTEKDILIDQATPVSQLISMNSRDKIIEYLANQEDTLKSHLFIQNLMHIDVNYTSYFGDLKDREDVTSRMADFEKIVEICYKTSFSDFERKTERLTPCGEYINGVDYSKAVIDNTHFLSVLRASIYLLNNNKKLSFQPYMDKSLIELDTIANHLHSEYMIGITLEAYGILYQVLEKEHYKKAVLVILDEKVKGFSIISSPEFFSEEMAKARAIIEGRGNVTKKDIQKEMSVLKGNN